MQGWDFDMANEESKGKKGIYRAIKEATDGRKLLMALFFTAFSILMIYLIGFPMVWYWKAGFTGIIMLVLAIFLVSRHSGRRSHALAALVALAYMSLVLMFSVLAFLIFRFAVFASESDLEAYFRMNPEIGLWTYFLVNVIQPLFMPTPEAVTTMAGSTIFGPWTAFLLGYLGTMTGITAMTFLASYFKDALIDRIVSLKHVERFRKAAGRHHASLVLVLFILPVMPDEAVILGAVLAGYGKSAIIGYACAAKIITQGVYSFTPVFGMLGADIASEFAIVQWILVLLYLLARSVIGAMKRQKERNSLKGGSL
jgi:uncharacterized membrane protein YdjX (TVP38/TMEM64 family)